MIMPRLTQKKYNFHHVRRTNKKFKIGQNIILAQIISIIQPFSRILYRMMQSNRKGFQFNAAFIISTVNNLNNESGDAVLPQLHGWSRGSVSLLYMPKVISSVKRFKYKKKYF